ncbi:NAD(P)/FAD-dependent oxidoreductase [Nocardia sp. NPDC057668]|uniref:NAD(P)/FAD-dependent oxidoreductase n=1 Tax=Nocardia sp. NPDC057668 TaxID=3346202 RepID=UPI00366E5C58
MTRNSTTSKTEVVVIGGGYAGTVAANRLGQREDVAVTLVNARSRFVERLRLHQLVAGSGTVTADYGPLLGERVRLVVDAADRIDTASRTVRLASGRDLGYDYVVYAVGSTAAVPGAIPGATEFAYPLAELENAERLRARLAELPPGAPVTVVGGGLTGIETAAELIEQGWDVTLVCGGKLAPTFSERARHALADWLARHDVRVIEGMPVTEVQARRVLLADDSVVPGAVTIWTAGFGVPELARRSGLRTDRLGRLLTDETLTSLDDDRVLAAGDAAAPSNRPLRMSCQAAGPLGAQAAETILSRVAGTRPAALDMGFLGANVSLGRRAAVVQFTHRDDTPRRLVLRGRVAAPVKEGATRATLWAIRTEARRPGSLIWAKGGPRPAAVVLDAEEVGNP